MLTKNKPNGTNGLQVEVVDDNSDSWSDIEFSRDQQFSPKKKNGHKEEGDMFSGRPHKEEGRMLLKRESDLMFDLTELDLSSLQPPEDRNLRNEFPGSPGLP